MKDNKFQNQFGQGIKYFITNNNDTTVVSEHEFKHFLRHNNLRKEHYEVCSFSTVSNGYIVKINKEVNAAYKSKRHKVIKH